MATNGDIRKLESILKEEAKFNVEASELETSKEEMPRGSPETREMFKSFGVNRAEKQGGGAKVSPSSVNSSARTSAAMDNTDGRRSWIGRIRFPQFDGDEELELWLCQCRNFFDLVGTPDSEKVRLAAMHLAGKALQWHQSLTGPVEQLAWESYEKAISARFGRDPYEDPLIELKNLYQSDSLEEYMDSFDCYAWKADLSEANTVSLFLGGLKEEIQYLVKIFKLKPPNLMEAVRIARIQQDTYMALCGKYETGSLRLALFNSGPLEDPLIELKNLSQSGSLEKYVESFYCLVEKVDLTEANAVSLFLGGLKGQIQFGVRMFKPQSLRDAIGLAKLQEAANMALDGTNRTGRSISVNERNMHPVPKVNNPTYGTSGGSGRFRIVSSDEVNEKRDRGLCGFCDVKFVPGHNCFSQIFALEAGEENEAADEDEEDGVDEAVNLEVSPVISLQVLSGIDSDKMMIFSGFIGGEEVHILISSGSTHNYLNSETCRRLGCKTKKVRTIEVEAVSGRPLLCNSISKGLTWKMQGEEFCADFLIVPSIAYDMVLGAQWLASLGIITWNFRKLEMTFEVEGRVCKLQRSAKRGR